MGYSVYKHTFPNGKVYIGITSQSPERRWRNGNGYLNKQNKEYKQPLIANAILKYGWDNVRHDILFSDLTKEEAEQKEIQLILICQSNDVKFGYNVANGGNCTGTVSEYTKKKISKANKNKVTSESTKKKISRSLTGKHHTENTKQKISNANKKHVVLDETKEKLRKLNKCKRVRCVDDNKVYDSIANASKQTGINKGSILNACNGKCKTAGNYSWEFV